MPGQSDDTLTKRSLLELIAAVRLGNPENPIAAEALKAHLDEAEKLAQRIDAPRGRKRTEDSE